MANNRTENGFRWESGYEKTWDNIKESDSGGIVSNFDQVIKEAHEQLRKKRRKMGNLGPDKFVRLGIMRHMYIILDLSSAMTDQDLKPSRLLCSLKLLNMFIQDFFDQNPISQLGLIITCDKQAERITELSGNLRYHLSALKELVCRTCQGEPSLQNALILAESRLKYLSSHTTREILVIMGSQTTCDPGDIHKTITSLVQNKIKCNVISLAVEVFVYHALAKATKGSFNVILDSLHLKQILLDKVPPPLATEETQASLIKMGFPHNETFDLDRFPNRMCMCHVNTPDIGGSSGSKGGNFACPRCKSCYCELPMECQVCGLTLVAAPHLARAYHHLFPLPAFEEVGKVDHGQKCMGCSIELRQMGFRCPSCKGVFCVSCDLFIHESVHSCPSCAMKASK